MPKSGEHMGGNDKLILLQTAMPVETAALEAAINANGWVVSQTINGTRIRIGEIFTGREDEAIPVILGTTGVGNNSLLSLPLLY